VPSKSARICKNKPKEKKQTCQFSGFNKPNWPTKAGFNNGPPKQHCKSIQNKYVFAGSFTSPCNYLVIHLFGPQKTSICGVFQEFRPQANLLLWTPQRKPTVQLWQAHWLSNAVGAQRMFVEYMQCWSLATKKKQDKGRNMKMRSLVIKIRIFHCIFWHKPLWTFMNDLPCWCQYMTILLVCWFSIPSCQKTRSLISWLLIPTLFLVCWVYYLIYPLVI
jgi:hypothetical protein